MFLRNLRRAAIKTGLFVCLMVWGGDARAQQPAPDPGLWTIDHNYGYCLATAGNTLYVGGEFDYIGPQTGSLVFVDATTGALLPLGTVAAGTCVSRIVVHPSGGLLLALAANGHELRSYGLDRATGAPVEPAASSVAVDAGTALALSPSGSVVYVAEPAGILAFSVDTTGGRLARVPGTPAPFPSPYQSPTAGLVTADGSFLFVAAAGLPDDGRRRVVLRPRPDHGSADRAGRARGRIRGVRAQRHGHGPRWALLVRPASTAVRPHGCFPAGTRAGGRLRDRLLGQTGGPAGEPVPRRDRTKGSRRRGGERVRPGREQLRPRPSATGGSVSVYAADAGTGRLSEVPGSPFFVAAATVNALAVVKLFSFSMRR